MTIDALTFDSFKGMASEFFKALPKLKSKEQVEAGERCLYLAYTSLEGNENEQHQARLLLDIATRKANKRVLDILFAGLK